MPRIQLSCMQGEMNEPEPEPEPEEEEEFTIQDIVGYIEDSDEVRVRWYGFDMEEDTYIDRQAFFDQLTDGGFEELWTAWEASTRWTMESIVGYERGTKQIQICFVDHYAEDNRFFTKQDLIRLVGQDKFTTLWAAWETLLESASTGSDTSSGSDSGSDGGSDYEPN